MLLLSSLSWFKPLQDGVRILRNFKEFMKWRTLPYKKHSLQEFPEDYIGTSLDSFGNGSELQEKVLQGLRNAHLKGLSI